MPIIFADRKKIAGAAAGKSNMTLRDEYEVSDDMRVLQALAKDAIDAIHAGSASDFARALKSFFKIVDALPHEEGPHMGEE